MSDAPDIETEMDAVVHIREHLSDRAIIDKEFAMELAEPFGVTDEEVFSFQKLKHMDRISESDDPAIGVADFLADLAEALGYEAERPTYGGSGFTAQARYDANYPTIEDHVTEDE